MSYLYSKHRAYVFTEAGQNQFIEIRDKAFKLCDLAGCVRMSVLLSGDTWNAMACVDRLVERGELEEIPQKDVLGQYRIFERRING